MKHLTEVEAKKVVAILEERLEMVSHNLMCYSQDYLCEKPKDGFLKEHADTALEEADIISLIYTLKNN